VITRLLRGSHGTVLVVAMLLMTTLAIIGIATNMNVVTDTGIASNYLSSLQSFYMAEAGLERGKTECAERFTKGDWSGFNSILRGPDDASGTADDGILSFGLNVSFHDGRYSVRVVNEAGDGGGPGTDTNSTITLISTGSYGNSATTLSSTIAMNVLPYLPGSVSLVGHASARFANDTFLIDGRDYLLSDVSKPSGTSPPRSGISISDVVSPNIAKEEMIKSLGANQIDNISGAEPSPSIEISTALNKALLKQLIDALKRVADNRIANPGDILSTSGPDNSVAINGQSYSLGTASTPKVTYLSRPSGGTISLSGSGFGILIMEGNNLCLKPAIHFSGVIILAGNNVVLDDSGSSTGLQLNGGMVVLDSSGDSSGYDLNIAGNSRILYSQDAINQIKSYLMKNKKYSVLSWQRSY
jgi:hypothetical protein